jgi:hypothetical protein
MSRAPSGGGWGTTPTAKPTVIASSTTGTREATAWVETEIDTIVDTLQRAKLTARAGHLPRPALRSAAVALAALDAALSGDLEIVRRMRAEAVAS